jgi:hypothetical protein
MTSFSHVPDDRLLDAVLGEADPRDTAHLAACDRCRTLVAEAAQGLASGADVAVPEPSPLYWESFRAQVSRRLDEPAAPARRRFFAPALLAAAAVVAVIGLLPTSSPDPDVRPPAATLAAWSALPAQEDDPGLVALEGLQAEPVDLAGAGACTDVTACLAAMSDEESGELADLLRAELEGGTEL